MSTNHALNNKSCIIVLGMHRSGTSALAGILSKLGVFIGNEVSEKPSSSNPKGHWENKVVVDFHERLLEQIGASWNDEKSLPEEWWNRKDVEPFKEELLVFIRESFNRSTLWGFKDPRICRLLPIWLESLKEAGVSPKFIFILREPQSVSRSLFARDGISETRGYILWLRHVLEAERWSRNLPRSIVTHSELLKNWRSTIKKVNYDLCLKLPHDEVQSQRIIDDFVDPAFNHHHNIPILDNEFAKLAERTYKILRKAAETSEDMQTLEAIEDDLDQICKPFAEWSCEIQTLFRAHKEDQIKAHELDITEMELNRIKSSFSWKITAPLRVIANLIK